MRRGSRYDGVFRILTPLDEGMHQIVSGFTSDPFGSTTEQLENIERFAIEVMYPYRGR